MTQANKTKQNKAVTKTVQTNQTKKDNTMETIKLTTIEKKAVTSLKANFTTLDKLQTQIKELNGKKKDIVKKTIPLLKQLLNEIVANNPQYATLKKRQKLQLLKNTLDTKNKAINIILNAQILGLNFDNNVSLAAIEKSISYVNKGLISKSKINKCATVEDLLKELKTITNEELKKKYSK